MTEKNNKLPRLHGLVLPLLAMVIFAALFLAATKIFPPFTDDISSSSISDIFKKYSPYAGAGFGLLSLILMYVLYIFRALFRLGRSYFSAPVILILGYAPWLAFGWQLVYREPRYAQIARAIISYLGKPMFYSGMAMAGIGFLWLIIILIKRPSK